MSTLPSIRRSHQPEEPVTLVTAPSTSIRRTDTTRTFMSSTASAVMDVGTHGGDHGAEYPSRRRRRHEVPAFRGASHEEPDSDLPPRRSPLPDITNWRVPSVRSESVSTKMGHDKLAKRERFEKPFVSEKLQQPDPLPCKPFHEPSERPLLGGTADSMRNRKPLIDPLVEREIARRKKLKQHKVPPTTNDNTPIPTLRDADGGDLTTLAQRQKEEDMRDAQKKVVARSNAATPAVTATSTQTFQLPSAIRSGASRTPAPGAAAAPTPEKKSKRYNNLAELETSDYSRSQIDDFAAQVGERVEFAEFLNTKSQTMPVMVFKHFRHQICEASKLVDAVRAVPLSAIEKALADLGPRTITLSQFGHLLHKIIGPDFNFSRMDCQSLYSFFDTDGDGDIDQRELCNGFVVIRSKDGPLVTVLHRCQSLLHQNIKDTRLTFMSRFELVLMAQAITTAAKDALTEEELAKLDKKLKKMLTSFGTNRRGQFPFDEVRKYVLRSQIITKALNSFTVPRDAELHKSTISHYLRFGDVDEGEQQFKLMMSLKAFDKRAQGPIIQRRAEGYVDESSGDEDDNEKPSTSDIPTPQAVTTAPSQSAQRRGSACTTLPPPTEIDASTTRGGDSDDDLSPKDQAGPARRPSAAPPAAATSTEKASTSTPSYSVIDYFSSSIEREVYEPGEPTFFVVGDKLFRQFAGEDKPHLYTGGHAYFPPGSKKRASLAASGQGQTRQQHTQ